MWCPVLHCSFRTLDFVSILSVLLLYCIYFQYLKNPRFLIPFSFCLIGVCSFNFLFAIVIRLSFRICLAKVAIGICLVFCVAGCVMVICRSFLVGLLNRLGDCDSLFVLGTVMVICPIRLVLRDRDLLTC